ncbi:MAG: hypothetical protein Q4F54_02755 [Coriobacteriia bacterium]|nr:hypothetical protein [Coriobacteriia bacterium]
MAREHNDFASKYQEIVDNGVVDDQNSENQEVVNENSAEQNATSTISPITTPDWLKADSKDTPL